jgi:hypothetical protein
MCVYIVSLDIYFFSALCVTKSGSLMLKCNLFNAELGLLGMENSSIPMDDASMGMRLKTAVGIF